MWNNIIRLEDLSRETLLNLIKMYSKNWMTVDGLWFRNVEEEFGTEVATRLDEKMWLEQTETEARRMKEVLGISGGGFEAMINMLNFMTWNVGELFHHELEEIGPEKITLSCIACPPQEARLRRGLEEFPCKQVGINAYRTLAKLSDPRIKLDCTFCPPDPHPKDKWCKWALSIAEE